MAQKKPTVYEVIPKLGQVCDTCSTGPPRCGATCRGPSTKTGVTETERRFDPCRR